MVSPGPKGRKRYLNVEIIKNGIFSSLFNLLKSLQGFRANLSKSLQGF